MERSRFPKEQIIGNRESTRLAVRSPICAGKYGISNVRVYKLKAEFGGMEFSEAKRPKTLDDDNMRLNPLLVDATLDNGPLKDLLAKK